MPVEYNPNPPPLQDPVVTLSDPSLDFLVHIQEAISSPSPLTRIIEDPGSFLGQSKPKSRHSQRPSRSSPHREHRSPYVFALALAEEERQANTLKSLLRSTSDQLDYERRRAEEATSQAGDADLRVHRANFRATAAESAQKQFEEEVTRLKEELRRVQLQKETLEHEARKSRDEIRRLERENEDLQDSEHRAKENLRSLQSTLAEYQNKQDGLEASRREAIERSFEEGQDEGWNLGYKKGYKEGRRAGHASGVVVGRREGVREGWEQGRNEEHRNALEAFDRFLAEENGQGHLDATVKGIRTYYPGENESMSSLGDSASKRGPF